MASTAKARLNHAAIFVSDLDRAVEFYEQAFGLTLQARWLTGERVTDGKQETMGLPGAHLIDSKGCRIELWELADQTGSEHSQKPVNHFGMGAPAGAAIRLDAEPQPMATGAVAG